MGRSYFTSGNGAVENTMNAVSLISTNDALFARVRQLVGKKRNADFNSAVLMQPDRKSVV